MKRRTTLKVGLCGFAAVLAATLWGLSRPSPLAKQLTGVWRVSVAGSPGFELMMLEESGRVLKWDSGQGEFTFADSYWAADGDELRLDVPQDGNLWRRVWNRAAATVGIRPARGSGTGYYSVTWSSADSCRLTTQYSAGNIALDMVRESDFDPRVWNELGDPTPRVESVR